MFNKINFACIIIGTYIGSVSIAVPITDMVKIRISAADISANPIIGTPLV